MNGQLGDTGFTVLLASQASNLRFDELPPDLVERSRQCLLDWLGVALAGSTEEATSILLEELADLGGGSGQGTVVGHCRRLPIVDAALVNGTAGHALDYDDVNQAMTGHPSAPILPAVLALAEHVGATGSEVITAFVAGYEIACRLGRALGADHYGRGFHTTGTVGALGAAAASANLLGLDTGSAATALGLAATQAAGLRSVFGTMGKPLHAGRAAAIGLLSARLAARDFSAPSSVIETALGFAETHSESFDPSAGLQDPPLGWYLRANLFKYHASCFQTQSPLEGLIRMRKAGNISVEDVETVTIHASPLQMGICAIPEPTTGLETKFSLRHVAALALAGIDTSDPSSFSDASAGDPYLVGLRQLVRIVPDGVNGSATLVEIVLRDGRRLTHAYDTSIPEPDLGHQRLRVEAKFHALALPVLGSARSAGVVTLTSSIEEADEISSLMQMLGGPVGQSDETTTPPSMSDRT